ncbi:38674_t:CDS:1, partial [Gigaspora margarita]
LQNLETAFNIFSISENELQEYSKTNKMSESNQLLAKYKYVSSKRKEIFGFMLIK